MSRDWMATLLPASYGGVPFWVKEDSAETGRRLHVAVFPGANQPFIEDLGLPARRIEISGYTTGDASDAILAALEAAAETQGPATLVMPSQGPIQARCEKIKRRRDRDKMGYFGFEATFVREGISSVLTPMPYLAQTVFNGLSQFTSAAIGFLQNSVAL